MKSDLELKEDVQNELRWDETLINDEIVVNVEQGVTTLSGTVDSAQKKQTAENIAREVEEIKSVINKIQVMPKENDLSKSTFGEQENLLSDTEDKSLKISGA
jgi:osmotically-inducible protein OsmY